MQPNAPALAKPVKLVFGEYVENYVADEPTAALLRPFANRSYLLGVARLDGHVVRVKVLTP